MIEVIGTDAGAPATLPVEHQQRLRQAALIAAPKRLHPALRAWAGDSLPELLASDQPQVLLERLGSLAPDAAAVVLASGDPLWFGIGRLLLEGLPAQRLRFHPAPSSLQLAFARIGRPWQDAGWLSLHGRDPDPLTARLQQRPAALAVLTDPGQGGADDVRRCLRAAGLEPAYRFWLCERLGHAQERVQCLAPHEPLPADLDPLHLVLLVAQDPALPQQLPLFGLPDGVFLQHPDRVLLGGGGRDRRALLQAVLDRLRPGGVVVIPLATLEALAELRPVLEAAGLQVSLTQHQAWRGAPLADGTRLAPLNPVLVLRGERRAEGSAA